RDLAVGEAHVGGGVDLAIRPHERLCAALQLRARLAEQLFDARAPERALALLVEQLVERIGVLALDGFGIAVPRVLGVGHLPAATANREAQEQRELGNGGREAKHHGTDAGDEPRVRARTSQRSSLWLPFEGDESSR